MEDDDEFGDLYSDVLQPFTTPSAPLQPPAQSSEPPSRSIDRKDSIPSDDEEILYGAPSSSNLNFAQPDANQNSKENDGNPVKIETYSEEQAVAAAAEKDSGARVLASGSGDLKVEEKECRDDNNGFFLKVKEENLEGNFGIGEELEIPGLSSGVGVSERGGEEGDDWDDSDSEDDLQIVLNDDDRVGMMGMEGIGGEDDMAREDGENLITMGANDDPNHLYPPMEDLQDWGEDAGLAAEGGGDRKDLLGGDAGKVQGGEAAVAPKMGYGGQGYHPFHSQFKYVRPGATSLPGAAPTETGGVPGQVRPPAGMLPFAGRGRGDWHPTGIKSGLPMQKNFLPGYGMPGWGSNGAGRGFGIGLDFMLPSHK